jgi:hypothetical protein
MSIYFKNLDLSKMNSPKKPRSRKPSNQFPVKLYQMLEDVAQTGKEDIVGWAPDGLSFRVHDTEPFMKEVLPLYFNQTKYKSFLRQLNFYGFTRITEGPLELQGSYSNKFFIRGKREMCKNITRLSNNQGPQQTSSHFDDFPSLSPAQSLAVIRRTSLREFQQSLMSFNVADALSDVDDDLSLMFEDYPKLQPQESILADGSKVSFIGKKFYFLENEDDFSGIEKLVKRLAYKGRNESVQQVYDEFR